MPQSYVLLGDVARFYSGGTPSKARPDFWQGHIPWVSPKDMGPAVIEQAEDSISDEAVTSSATRLVPAGTILVVSRSGILARTVPIGITGRSVAFNQDIQAVAVDASRAIPHFIAAAIRAQEPTLLANGVKRGATVHSLNSGFLRRLAIPLPPLPEQRRIVDLLNRAAGIRRLREAALAKARETIAALFLSMFGDPASNPMGWPLATLSELVPVIDSGWSPKCDEGGPSAGEWGVLKLGAVTWGEFNDADAKRLPLSLSPRSELEVQAGDILLVRKNTAELVGAVAYVWSTRPQLMLSDLIFRLRPSPQSAIRPPFLWGCLAAAPMRNVTRRLASGAAASMPNISKGRLANLVLPLPPLALQDLYGSRLADLRAIIAQQEHALALARNTERALMAQLLG